MRQLTHLSLLLASVLPLRAACQQLQLDKKIPVVGMTGGFDHFAYDPASHNIFATAEDQGRVYVLSLSSSQQLATLDGFGKPHSVLVRSGASTALIIDSEKDKSALLDTSSLQVTRHVVMAPGANALIYDQSTGTAIITAGGDRVHMTTSQVVSIDPITGHTLMLAAVQALRLQPMDLDEAGGRVFVSIADHDSIGVFDVKSLRMLAEWKLGKEAHHHQPVAFDGEKHHLFVAIDDPGELVVVNTDTGKRVASIPIPGDADDLAYDAATQRVFVPCGDGFLVVVDASDPEHMRMLQKITTGRYAATGLWLPKEKTYLLGVPSGSTSSPEVQIFRSR